MASPLVSWPARAKVSSECPDASDAMGTASIIPYVLRPCLSTARSGRPVLLKHPIMTPCSPPSPPHLLDSSTSSPGVSLAGTPTPATLRCTLRAMAVYLVSCNKVPTPVTPCPTDIRRSMAVKWVP